MNTEKYLFAQLLTRYALGLKSDRTLPAVQAVPSIVKGYEFFVLREARNLKCRNNLLRIVLLRYLSKQPLLRPPYELMMVWPCSWRDGKFLNFLIRFYEKLHVKNGQWQCTRFEEEVVPEFWFTKDKLSEATFNIFCEAIFKNDPKFRQKAERLPMNHVLTEGEKAEVARYVKKKGRLYGLFWQIRNREAHAFEIMGTFGATGSLSVGYVNFWREKFPLLMTASYLIAINLNFHLDESFREFFKGPAEFYDSFKNRSCSGERLQR